MQRDDAARSGAAAEQMRAPPQPPLSESPLDFLLDQAEELGVLTVQEIDRLRDSIATGSRNEEDIVSELYGDVEEAISPETVISARGKLLRGDKLAPVQIAQMLDTLTEHEKARPPFGASPNVAFIKMLLDMVVELSGAKLSIFVKDYGIIAAIEALEASMDCTKHPESMLDMPDLSVVETGLKLIAHLARNAAASRVDTLSSDLQKSGWSIVHKCFAIALESGAANLEARMAAMMTAARDVKGDDDEFFELASSIKRPSDIFVLGLDALQRLAVVLKPGSAEVGLVLDVMLEVDECEHRLQLAAARALEDLITRGGDAAFGAKHALRAADALSRATRAQKRWDIFRDPDCECDAHEELCTLAKQLSPKIQARLPKLKPEPQPAPPTRRPEEIEVRSPSGAPAFFAPVGHARWEVWVSEGDSVEVVGLEKRSDLNGCMGSVIRDVKPDDARIQVRVDKGGTPECVQVRPCNLILRAFCHDRCEVNFVRRGGDIEIKTPGWCASNGFTCIAPQAFCGDWWSTNFAEEEKANILSRAARIARGLRTHEQFMRPWAQGYPVAADVDQTDDQEACWQRALALTEQEEYGKAVDAWRKFISIWEREPSALKNLGECFHALGHRLFAVRTFLRGLEVLGELLIATGQVADELYEEPKWLTMVADVFAEIVSLSWMDSGDWWSHSLPEWWNDESLKVISNKAVTKLPDLPMSWWMRACVLSMSGDDAQWPATRMRYPDRSRVSPGPEHPRSVAELREAAKCFERAHELEPDTFSNALGLANAARARASADRHGAL